MMPKENIHKLDSLGQSLAIYAPQQFGKLTTLDTWASLRAFLFYENTQQYVFLDRYLAASEFSGFPIDQFGFVGLSCSSSDNQIWVLDLRPLQLTKYHANFNEITLTQSLTQLSDTLELNPYQMVEFQNRVYLGDSEIGILVFDNLGNYLRTLEKSGSSQFHLWENKLYYLTESHIQVQSLYSDQKESIPLPDQDTNYQHVLFLGTKTVLIAGNKLSFFRYKPR